MCNETVFFSKPSISKMNGYALNIHDTKIQYCLLYIVTSNKFHFILQNCVSELHFQYKTYFLFIVRKIRHLKSQFHNVQTIFQFYKFNKVKC